MFLYHFYLLEEQSLQQPEGGCYFSFDPFNRALHCIHSLVDFANYHILVFEEFALESGG